MGGSSHRELEVGGGAERKAMGKCSGITVTANLLGSGVQAGACLQETFLSLKHKLRPPTPHPSPAPEGPRRGWAYPPGLGVLGSRRGGCTYIPPSSQGSEWVSTVERELWVSSSHGGGTAARLRDDALDSPISI